MTLAEKVAVITGGTGNLGTVVTRRFLQQGARVVVPWHSEESWHSLRRELGDGLAADCRGIGADLTDEEQVRKVMDFAVDQFGNIDAQLNLVGGFAFGQRVWETELATWDKMMERNLKTAFLCCKHALKAMRQSGAGCIVNVSSKAAIDLQPGATAYAVAKGGIITLTRALREELKGTGIAVNAIMPGIIDTPVTRELMPEADHDSWVQPGQIAHVLATLCGGDMPALEGSVLRLFGGL